MLKEYFIVIIIIIIIIITTTTIIIIILLTDALLKINSQKTNKLLSLGTALEYIKQNWWKCSTEQGFEQNHHD